ncbi:hypothetical protein BBK36DRAFT_1144496 [Trichoderma citrinoviride]|uniref:F-box domain-containing protein n=1 Tax=Trichoderma citrinoviride TaxID=58853 RepID=A0A2T4B0W3_9HYPO|nr:hypothetical protein BBK36DRAFT_1144496 [Trichoderma citrinoviride]PTB62962.1 hypothetical protein BBK36DRAFT_1144496 [Trichoderma citrinoviride]
MPQLLSLPRELIEHICRQLVGRARDVIPKPWDPKSLSHLCQTSKSMHRIGTPILYAGFSSSESGIQRSANFLRTISLRPELGELVRELHILVYRSQNLDQSQRDVFRKAAARLGVGIPGWLEHHPSETVAFLLVAQTPMLKTLDIYVFHNVYIEDDLSPFNIFEDASVPAPWRVWLPHLHHLGLGHSSEEHCLQYFGGILQFASGVADLTLRSSFTIPSTRALRNGLMHFANVTHLVVKGSDWTRSQLEAVVSRCLALEEFRYQSLAAENGHEPDTVNARELIDMLRQYGHNNTLRTLYMDLEDRDRYVDDEYVPRRCSDGEQILSLKDFSQLQTFCVDGSSMLFPAADSPDYRTNILTNLLPSCIRCFRLMSAPDESVANMLSLAESIADFPFLDEVAFALNDGYGEWDDSDDCDEPETDKLLEKLKDCLTAKGVRLDKGYSRWSWFQQ